MAPTINGKNLYKRLSIRRPDSADRRDGGDASIDRRRPRRSHGRANILRGTHPSYGGISTKAHGSASNLAGRSRDGDEAAGRPRRMPSDCDGCPPTVSIRRPPISASPCTPRPQPSNGRASPASFQAGSSAPCPCLRRGARPAPVRWRLSRPPAFSCRRECSHAPAPV